MHNYPNEIIFIKHSNIKLQHSGFVDDDVVDDSMLETNQQEDEDDDGVSI